MQWGGLLLGETTSYVGVQLTGWDDLPDLENGTVAMPTQHGAWPGPLLAGTRSLTWDFRILPARHQDFPSFWTNSAGSPAFARRNNPL